MKKNIRMSARFSVYNVTDKTLPMLTGRVQWDEEGNATVEVKGSWGEAVAEDLALAFSGMTKKERDQSRHSFGTSEGAVHAYMDLPHAAVAYYVEHATHPVPSAWRDLFARVYVREITRRDRAALARWHAEQEGD